MTDKQFNRMVLLESLFTSAKSLVIGVTVGMIQIGNETNLAWNNRESE